MRAVIVIVALIGLCAMICQAASPTAQLGAVTLETRYFRYVIGSDAIARSFIDKASRRNYAKPDKACSNIRFMGEEVAATAARFADGILTLKYGTTGISARVVVESRGEYLILRLLSVDGPTPEVLTFVNLELDIADPLHAPFAASTVPLNFDVNTWFEPGINTRLLATTFPGHGVAKGAQVALVGCPRAKMHSLLQTIMKREAEYVLSPMGGPWAKNAIKARESYISDYPGMITEANIDQWIALVKACGMQQLDFHVGKTIRHGDFVPLPDAYPHGLDGLRAVVEKVHAAGLTASFHTYMAMIDKHASFVTPVPDPGLGKQTSLTLAEDLSADDTALSVLESTAAMSPVIGFGIPNSATLQIDEELIIFSEVRKEAPFGFTRVERGAYGTRASAHAKGAKVYHLKEMYGNFIPDAGSSLFTKIAERTAHVVNYCGFDNLLYDASDTSWMLGVPELGWRNNAIFYSEVQKRLAKPVFTDMNYEYWPLRGRVAFWDSPVRGYKRAIDMHVCYNEAYAGNYLPYQLGWWAIWPWANSWNPTPGVQPARTFPDDIEYLWCKAIGHQDASVSILGSISPEMYAQHEGIRRLAGMIKAYETIRQSSAVPERIRARLREPEKEFTLAHTPKGAWRFIPVNYVQQTVDMSAPDSARWETNNPFASQPLRVRLEVLNAADKRVTTTILDANTLPAPTLTAEGGIAPSVEKAVAPEPRDFSTLRFRARNTGKAPETAWASAKFALPAPVNMTNRGMGVWVYGDGQGEILTIRLRQDQNERFTPVSDYPVRINFSGWRYVQFVEPETDWHYRYAWPETPRHAAWPAVGKEMTEPMYEMFNLWFNYGSVGSVSLMLGNLPRDKEVTCYLGPLLSLPLHQISVRNPSVTIQGRTLTFPGELKSGEYIEFQGEENCVVYGPYGERVRAITPQGEIPVLKHGKNRIDLHVEDGVTPAPRVNVTVISRGKAL